MMLALATRHRKVTACFLAYLFFLSGLCSFVYGQDYRLSYSHTPTNYDKYFFESGDDYSSVLATDPKEKDKGKKKPLDQAKRKQRSYKEAGGGPSQPEMTGFKPVGADNMVDPFTGDFSYNIPLLDVGGYPVNIYYSSGITMDQEASWVGLGWNINPGTITRNMRGLPDDFDGSEKIKKTQYVKADKTYGVNVGGRVEFFGGALGIGIDGGIFYNNMRGLGLEAGINPAVSIGGKSGDDKTAPISFGWKLNANSQSGGSSTFNIALKNRNEQALIGGISASIGVHSRQGLQDLHLSAQTHIAKVNTQNKYINAAANNMLNPTLSTNISFAYPAFTPAIRGKTSSENYDIDIGFGAATWGAFSHLRLGGYYTRRWVKPEDIETVQKAYGMIYLKKAQDDKNALMDFNRVNDGVYTPGTPAISIPVYTYDVFTINGEGTGGSFRAYRGDLGYMQDGYLENNGTSGHVGFEAGAGAWGHGAINARVVLTPSASGGWDKGNLARSTFQYKESVKDSQAVYFKNPGEKAIPDINFQNAVGGEDLVRLRMTNTGIGSPTLVPSFVQYSDMLQKKADLPIGTGATIRPRDKRTQVISFLTAEDADRAGLNKKIPYLQLNEADSNQVVFGCSPGKTMNRVDRGLDAIRKPNHISEIDVLMPDGRRYVYDIPVYNLSQVDVSFNKRGSGNGTGSNNPLTSYVPGTDDEAGVNEIGKDGFVEKQEMPAYTHSYLLTALLSPNYVDVKGDGITVDDMGDAIKFNYSKSDSRIKWRTPALQNNANLSEGLKTDKNDDKAHYVYGEREMWYLYSIESKNMVARFYVRNDRQDSRSVLGINGGIDASSGAYRLSKISLFTKGELLKRPNNPRPVKTVHFVYDYSLCAGAPTSVNGTGKLTLKAIYFTYNGNNRTKKNLYRFKYPEENNPSYSFTANDRWGNYKADPSSGLTNADFPYTDQSPNNTNQYIKAWNMNQVILPSGSSIVIDYESDDYAFVQDRRASNMLFISGFGNSPSPSNYSNKLYDGVSSNYEYIYVTVPKAITATSESTKKAQIQEWYLANYGKSKQVLMKLAIDMPTDQNGSGFEMIPIYAEVIDFGVITGTGGEKIWLKVKKLASNFTPMVHYSLQFLKSNLPSKAYPGYDVSEQGGLKSIVKALGGLFHSFKEIFNGGMKLMVGEGKCKSIQLDKSFIRLTDPNLKKLGGGLRVRKVVIHDNWDKLTRSNPQATDGMLQATYGQEYFYTKKELVNGELTTISSGVASWEPSMGGEENPHRQALEFYNRTPKADYDYKAMEMPIAEMMYPSAIVGYSRVESRSIHRDTVKNAAGISVTEFYTTREFPTTSSFTPLSEHNAEDRYESGALDKMIKADLKTAVALSQGFKVDLNDMNGKMKKQATYSPNNLNDPIAYTENFYSMVRTGGNSFRLNHNFPVIKGADGKVSQSIIGREIELMTDFREHKQQTITTNVDFNIDIINGVFIPIPIPTTWRPIIRESNIYRSSSILKIVNHFSVLDSVVAVDKGSMVSTKNLVYDAETGDPLLTRTNNEHNQPIYNFSYPAHWAYSGMGLAYKNIDVVFYHVTFRNGKIDAGPHINLNLLESGDELLVSPVKGWQIVPGASPCEPPLMFGAKVPRIWAIYSGKSGSATPQWLFIDANGEPVTASDVTVRVIRSGKRNMFSAGLGNIVTLNNPINASTGQIEFTDATNIVQTTAAAYKDHWRVDNSLFRFDSTATVQQYARVKCKSYPVSESISIFARYDSRDHDWPVEPQVNLSPNSILAFRQLNVVRNNNGVTGRHTEADMVDHWLRFNIAGNPLPSGGILYRAKLSLGYHNENHNTNYPTDYQASHTLRLSHYNRWGLVRNPRTLIPNNISAYRLNTNWPTGTQAQKEAAWKNIFKDPGRNLHYWNSSIAEVADVPFGIVGRSNMNYLLNNSFDNRINLSTTAVQGLLDDAAAGKTTAIRAFVSRQGFGGSIIDGNRVGNATSAQQCFHLNSEFNAFPYLNVYYYVCGDVTMNPGCGNTSGPDNILNQLIPCSTITQQFTECRSKFLQRKSVNPYVEGIWGNWRVDTTFVYYGDKKENAVVDGSPVDTRIGGTILNYKPFWNFSALSTGILTRNYSAWDVWTWNSSITQYNRRGYEVENKDPLGRYNAGLYGYNQQMPVAVVNNSRYMESLFDGFEDYDYQSNSCTEPCKPRNRVDMGNIQSYLNWDQKHTGKASLKVNAGQAFTFYAPVVHPNTLDKPYSVRVRVDSTAINDTVVAPNGNGIRGRYLKFEKKRTNNLMFGEANGVIGGIDNNVYTYSRNDPNIHLAWNGGYGTPVGWGNFVAKWQGYLLPKKSGIHYFKILFNDGMRLWINGLTLDGWGVQGTGSREGSVHLIAGQPYSITAEYWDGHAGSDDAAILLWKDPAMNSFEIVPQSSLYRPDNLSGAQAAVSITTTWCTKLDSVNVRGNALTDTFTLIQNKPMVVSAWVKLGGNDCKCSTYLNNKIKISYTGSSTVTEFTPSGSIIEGWQRYEGVFTIPSSASKIKVELINSNSSASAWFDDLRIHPFNANMKSFVYNPQSLRLTSEIDENNYASFYEYDDDGTVSRVKKETVKGIKTVTETRSHLQKAMQ